MRIKTFYTKTMPEALREVKSHFGPEALILSTKEIRRRSGVWGSASGFEVVAAIDDSDKVDIYSPRVRSASIRESQEDAPALETYSAAGRFGTRMHDLKPVAGKKRLIAGAASIESLPEKEPPFKGRVPASIYNDLVICGVDPSLAGSLLQRALVCASPGQRRSRQALMRSVTQAALEIISVPPCQNGSPAKKIVAFVGPTGVGKTTSIAKLAAHLALKKKKKVILMTMDGYRIGAIEQLRSYAGLMGIPFRYISRVSDLAAAIQENRQRDYILIDTAGRGPGDLHSMQKLAAFLKGSNTIERHLVLSATTKPSDLRKITDQFEICGPDHLLFTKLDETTTTGPILNELVRTRKSFSYYTDGQKVPDDLHPVARERIMDIVLNRNDSATRE
jgi:flagellar biosynthesis protein FlhF